MGHSIEDVRRVQREHRAEILAIPGVTGVGVGRRANHSQDPSADSDSLVIRVYVAKLPGDPNLPERLDGVPVEVIERRFTPHSNGDEESA